MLPPAVLRVCQLAYIVMELTCCHGQITVLRPPSGEEFDDRLPAPIACLCLADPLNWILTTEGE